VNAIDGQFDGHVVALTGGVGGAKLVLGLSRLLDDKQLTAIVNTGDDFEHLGLPICPDLDTLMYTLADLVNPETGWGCRNETWNFMEALEKLGAETWFRIGDRDLATHVMRAQRLAGHATLTEVTQALCERLSIRTRILPMSDMPVRTRVVTDRGRLDFQHYFVRDRTEPVVRTLEYAGAESAEPTPAVLAALGDPELSAIIIAPSNPYLSIDPILAVPGLRAALQAAAAPIVAVSPIVGGIAIKGPTAKIMAELGIEPSPGAVARHYGGLLDGFIVDEQDRDTVSGLKKLDLPVRFYDTIMNTLDDKIRLARDTLDFARSITPSHSE
jgi:LPPG:FO 2-phospho-L-lactate transferase